MNTMQVPPLLQKGQKVGVIATAGSLKPNQLDKGIAILERWGLEVILGKSLFAQDGYFAGTDQNRLADLQTMLDNPEIKGVFCARGGYGTTRIIDKADFTLFKHSSKWLIGFSDITTLHSHLHQLGFQSIHAPTVSIFGESGVDKALHSLLFQGYYRLGNIPTHAMNRAGEGLGALVGGNLSLLTGLVGTQSDINTNGKILFIEEVGEPLYHLDRMMTHLLRAGKLANLAGLAIGGLTSMTNPEDKFNQTAEQIIRNAVQDFKYPVAFNIPSGHQKENYPLIFGREYSLTTDSNATTLEFRQAGSM